MAALSISAGSSPKARIAASNVTPSASLSLRSAESNRPAAARLPINGTPKRTPSSSLKAMISMGSGILSFCAISAHSSARVTPRMPSNAPALGTVSMCEPRISRLLLAIQRLPKAAQVAGSIDAHRHAESFHALAQQLMHFAYGRREKPSRGATRLFAHGRRCADTRQWRAARVLSLIAPALCRVPRQLCAPARKTGAPRNQVSSTRPSQFSAEIRRDFMPEIAGRKARRSTWLRDRRRQSPRRRPLQSRLCARSCPPAWQAQPPSILRCAPARCRVVSCRSTAPAGPAQGLRCRPTPDPSGQFHLWARRRFISGRQGEWSVVTISISPSLSAFHSASRFRASRIGGAHLYWVAPSGIVAASNQR